MPHFTTRPQRRLRIARSRRPLLASILLFTVSSACSGSGSSTAPSSPTSAGVSAAGDWVGTFRNSFGADPSGTLTMTLTQSGNSVTGTWRLAWSAGYSGTISGVLTPYASDSATFSSTQLTVTSPTTGNGSCTTAF